MPDFLPRDDDAFAAWLGSFVAYVCDHQAELPVTPAQVAALTAAAAPYQASRSDLAAATAALRAATQTHAGCAAGARRQVREVARMLRASPDLTDPQRAGMGLRPRDTTLTPTAEPATVPLARVDAGQRLRHRLHFADAAAPTRRAKPAGVRGCEVWLKLGGDPPAGKADVAYVDTATRTPFVVEFQGEDAGKTAHYMLRWVGTRGAKGGWSETVSATVGA